MNRKTNLVAFLVFFFSFIFVAEAATPLDVDFHIVSDINKQTLYIVVTDTTKALTKLDIDTVINETDFNINEIKNYRIYIETPIPHEKPIYKEVCEPFEITNETGYNLLDRCSIIQTGAEVVYKNEWIEHLVDDIEKIGDIKLKQFWKNIPLDYSTNSVRLKLEFDTPIVSRTNGGWGSEGTVYLESGGDVYVDKTNSSWWNTTWVKRYEVNITNHNGTYALAEYIANITINTSVEIANNSMNANCSDIRVVEYATNLSYNFDIENCNNVSTIVWTQLTPFPLGTTRLYVYFNNSDIGDSDSGSDVWANYTIRLALNSTAGNISWDSSPNNWHGTARNGIDLVSGKFGRGYDFFKQEKNYINISQGIPVPVTSLTGSVCWWYKTGDPRGYFDKDSKSDELTLQGDGGNWFLINWNINAVDKYAARTDGGGAAGTTSSDFMNLTGWNHICFAWNTTHQNFYVGGHLNSTRAVAIGGSTNAGSDHVFIGSQPDLSASRFINATLDEFRVRASFNFSTGAGYPEYTDNETHAMIIPDEQINITIGAVENNFVPPPPTVPWINVTVFSEIDTSTQIEYYNLTIYEAGAKVYNVSGVNTTRIDARDLNIAELNLKLDKEGYRARYYWFFNTNTSQNLTGYLLLSTSSVNVGYQVVDTTGRPISTALVNIQKNINATYTNVTEHKTDSSGFISVYLDPDTTYQLTTSKSGYSSDVRTSRPVAGNSYLIVLNKTLEIDADTIWFSNSFEIKPQQKVFSTCKIVTFNFSVANIKGNLSFMGMNITLNDTLAVAYLDNTTANHYGSSLNRTLNLSIYAGNLTVIVNFTDSEYGTVMMYVVYQIDKNCQQGYSLLDLLNAFEDEDHGFSKELAGLFLIFLISFAATSASVVVGGNGVGLVGLSLLALLPSASIISWEIYIFIGICTFVVMYLKRRF